MILYLDQDHIETHQLNITIVVGLVIALYLVNWTDQSLVTVQDTRSIPSLRQYLALYRFR